MKSRYRFYKGTGVPLPNLFVIGAPKSGTTALHHLLDGVDGLAPCAIKEPNYFENDRHYEMGIESYSSLFEQGTGNASYVAYESTPWYLYSEKAADRIANDIGLDVALVVCIRDPVERAISHYRDFVGGGLESRSFYRAFSENFRAIEQGGPRLSGRSTAYLDGSHYAEALAPWVSIFGSSAVSVVKFSEITKSPRAAISQISLPLGLSIPCTDADETVRIDVNRASGVRFQRIESAIKRAARSRLGAAAKAGLPLRTKLQVGQVWRRAFRTERHAPGISLEEHRWLREAVEDLFDHQLARLSALGLDIDGW